MKKFDGILLTSDWDGTLSYDKTVTDINRKAIRYFTDNGGKFTVCSGRHYSYINGFSHLVKPNTYIISLNGALIYDVDTAHCLYDGFCDETLPSLLSKISDLGLYENLHVYNSVSNNPVPIDQNHLEDLSNMKLRKALFYTQNKENGILGPSLAKKLDLGNYVIARSWDTSLEVMHKNNTKGEAIKRIKNTLGVHTVVAVGDYENDIAMFEAANHSYAVENACEEIKKVADKMTSSVYTASIADVISDIEKNLI